MIWFSFFHLVEWRKKALLIYLQQLFIQRDAHLVQWSECCSCSRHCWKKLSILRILECVFFSYCWIHRGNGSSIAIWEKSGSTIKVTSESRELRKRTLVNWIWNVLILIDNTLYAIKSSATNKNSSRLCAFGELPTLYITFDEHQSLTSRL